MSKEVKLYGLHKDTIQLSEMQGYDKFLVWLETTYGQAQPDKIATFKHKQNAKEHARLAIKYNKQHAYILTISKVEQVHLTEG